VAKYVHDLLDRAAARTPRADAVAWTGGHLSFARLRELSHGWAAWLLDLGVERGDRVLVQSWNCAGLAVAVFGASRIGAVLVPVSPLLRPYQLRQVYDDAEPAVVIADADCLAGTRQAGVGGAYPMEALWAELARRAGRMVVRPVAPTDLALLVYTSGSTAAPKGVMSPHRQVMFATAAIARRLEYRSTDRVFLRLPMSFDYGLYQLFLTARCGATLYLADQRAAVTVVRELADSKATVVPIVPSLALMLNGMAARHGAPSTVRLFTNTGATLPPATIAELRKNFPGAAVVLMYGITECKRVSIGDPDGDLVDQLSLGPPLPGTEVFVVDADGNRVGPNVVGQLVVKGPHVMAGYWRAETLTRERFGPDPQAPVLYTGDFGRITEAGHIHFEGRRDDILKRQGTRVSTVEIEAAALDVPDVNAAAAVVAAGSAGDQLVLFVAGTVDAGEVARGVADRLDAARQPDRVVTLDVLPLGPNGKTDRSALCAMARAAQ
jgi:acyl-CoA synthetase (AMP-forming)/AMP-acid ligase II